MSETAEIRDQLKGWRHTYDGISVLESDDGEQLLTIGRVDKAAFVEACDAYYRDVVGEPIAKVTETPTTVLVTDVQHRKARISRLDEFPDGEFRVDLNEGDVDVTVLVVS